jgi:hypothetical protein
MSVFRETKLLEDVVCGNCGTSFNIKDCFISGSIITKDEVACVFIQCSNCNIVLGESWLKILEYKREKPIIKGKDCSSVKYGTKEVKKLGLK